MSSSSLKDSTVDERIETSDANSVDNGRRSTNSNQPVQQASSNALDDPDNSV